MMIRGMLRIATPDGTIYIGRSHPRPKIDYPPPTNGPALVVPGASRRVVYRSRWKVLGPPDAGEANEANGKGNGCG